MKKATSVLAFVLVYFIPTLLFSQKSFVIEKKKDHYGIRYGKRWELAPKYDTIVKVSDNCYVVKRKGVYGWYYQNQYEPYDFYGKEQFIMERPYCYQFNSGNRNEFSLADKNGLFRIIDKNGKEQSAFEYNEVIHLPNYSWGKKSDGKWELILAGQPSRVDFDSIYTFNGSTLCYWDKNTNGDFFYMTLLNKDGIGGGRMLYNKDYGKKKTWVKREGEYRIANVDLSLSEERYDSLGILSNGNYLVKTLKRNYQLFNSNFEKILSDDIEKLNILNNGNYLIKDTYGNYGILTPELDTVLPIKYGYFKFGDKYILGMERMKTYSPTDGAYNLYTDKGESLLEDYNLIEVLSPGKFVCRKIDSPREFKNTQDRYYDIYEIGKGFIEKDMPSKPVMVENFIRIDADTHYQYVNESWTKKSKKFPVGYIPRSGYSQGNLFTFFLKAITVIPLMVDIVTGTNPMGAGYYSYNEKVYGSQFENGLAMVGQKVNKKEIKFGLIDTSFNMVIPATYDELKAYKKIIFVRKIDHWSIINLNNQLLTGYEFTYYLRYTDDLFVVYNDKEYRILNGEGKETLFPHFKEYKRNKKGLLVLIVDTFERYVLSKEGVLIRIESYNYD